MSAASSTGPRRALRRLREVMAGSGSAQHRLDEIVRIIAAEMTAEVCSVYVLRSGDFLELFATEGLNPEAVHVTRLAVGEGLVGTIAATAEPLHLPDAQSHEKFSYRPETGEEIYSSLLGVPVIRGGRVRGVLVIQNRAQRNYTDDEEEALELISVVIAEMIASSDISPGGGRFAVSGQSMLSVRLSGVAINGGLASGRAVLHQQNVSIRQMFSDDPASEHELLRGAMDSMRSAIDDLVKTSRLSGSGEHRDVLDSYRNFAEDRGWMRRIREAIDSGLTAAAAVQKVREDTTARMGAVTDPYLRERLHDLEDLAVRLLQHLGSHSEAASQNLPEDIVILARNMGPAELLDYDTRRLRALVLEEGSATSHVAIVARALGLPVLTRVEQLMKTVDPLDPVIVDADNGQLFVRPRPEVRAVVEETLRAREQRRSAYAAMRDVPTITRDGVPISLRINCGLVSDMQWLDETGADGVGLFRTEIPFMVRTSFPDVDTQARIYGGILEKACGKPVVFRTLDIGGDKALSYFQHDADQNPALGWRAIRIGLDRPGLLRRQMRAMLRAAAGSELHLMFPMVAAVSEFDSARRLLDLETERMTARGETVPTKVRAGVMLEVPGLIWQLPALLPRVDFISVGSNDLFQFVFAADRANQRVSGRFDVLSPGFLAVLRDIVRRCDDAGVPVSLCGEMAGRPVEALALIGLGFRTLSMSPAMLGPVKAMALSMDAGRVGAFLDGFLAGGEETVRRRLIAYARDHGISLES